MLAQAAANGTSSSMGLWIAIAVGVIIVIGLLALISRRQRSDHLRKQFGPEYERHVRTIGSQSKAEADLAAREQRYRKLDIKPLTPGAKQRYLDEWRSLQSRFVDEPRAAIHDADVLIENVMRDRGYPTGDYKRQAEDLSVEHADVLDNYRVAHAIAQQSDAGTVSTEDMRKAVVAYRALFERLVGAGAPATRTP
jgi:Fe-S cluster assembly scaffold protein SufB